MTRAPQRRVGHVPMRRCLGCGAQRPRGDLARFVARPSDGGYTLTADPAGRAHGRGLYTCRHRDCFERAAKHNAFARGARVRGQINLAHAAEAAELSTEDRA